MRRVLLVALSLSGLTWMAAPPPEWRVGLRAAGPIPYGTPLREAVRLLGDPPPHELFFEGCDEVSFPGGPAGTSFMVIESLIVRIDVNAPGVLTRSGAGVGMTEAEILALYPGQIRISPHPYTEPEGHYLIFQPRDSADRAFGLIFETDGQRVERYRAGREPEVGWIEGCA